VQVATFYRFVPLASEELPGWRTRLLALASETGLLGTVLLATEGINGTVAGSVPGVAALLELLQADPRLANLEVKRSEAEGRVFHRFKVRLKAEIVTMAEPSAQPSRGTGVPVPPEDWNALLGDPGTLAIDTRNHYEVALGSFEGAIDPGTENFSDFPAWVEQRLRPLLAERRPQRLALFCTGGIRCEKATAYLLAQGFEEVLQLQGGILNYLEQVPRSAGGPEPPAAARPLPRVPCLRPAPGPCRPGTGELRGGGELPALHRSVHLGRPGAFRRAPTPDAAGRGLWRAAHRPDDARRRRLIGWRPPSRSCTAFAAAPTRSGRGWPWRRRG
jgi:predicted sulfurtransferase